MQLIFYHVVGQRANATNVNKSTDRCKIKKKKQKNRHVTIATSVLHHCAIQLHATGRVYFNALKFVWRKLQRFANCIFFFLNNRFLCTKECLTIFIYLEINWDGLQTETNDFPRFTTVL